MIIDVRMRVLSSAGALALAAGAALALPPNKVLFDATKAEMAGNADWVVDADVHNIGTGTGGAMVVGAGSDSNPQRFPTPPASGISASTPETYWQGSLSSWGVALVQHGLQVETLPVGGQITYGNGSNPQDLSNYSVYVVDEPNIRFTAAEKIAILNWVAAGGGLFMIADHDGSDRNNDGYDALRVWNDLTQSNSVATNPFGITFNIDNVSPSSTAVDTSANDPITRGAGGTVGQMIYHNGCTITISTAANASVRAAIWTTSSHTSANVMVAYATYGQGRVVACGDSSPFDDGTGDPGDTLYNGWSGEANGDHGKLAINGTLWLNAASACSSPSAQPVATVSVPDGAQAQFSAAASGTGPLTYQWRKNQQPLSDAGTVQGSRTATLTITSTTLGDAGSYDVVVSNACGSATSAAGSLTVNCDANCDGSTTVPVLNVGDFTCFLQRYAAGDPYANCDASTTPPVLNVGDFTCFLQRYAAGCP
jgi:hypothetical protein